MNIEFDSLVGILRNYSIYYKFVDSDAATECELEAGTNSEHNVVDMSISEDSQSLSESSSDSDDDFQTILRISSNGQTQDKFIEAAIKEKENADKSYNEKLHQVNVAVMETVLSTLQGWGVNAANLSDQCLINIINYVISKGNYLQRINFDKTQS